MALHEDELRPATPLPARHFLLFTGDAGTGDGEVVAAFHDEEEAREAYRRFQLAHPSGRGWGELSVLDARGRVEPLSWFGKSSPAADDAEDGEVVALAAAMRTRDRRRQRRERSALRRRARGTEMTPALRPVTDLP